MAKQVEVAVKSVLTQQGKSAIITGFCNALDSAENTGSLVTQTCNIAAKYLRSGEELPEADLESIVTGIAKNREWKDAVLRTRSSEVRSVLRQYALLPETIRAYSDRVGSCDWHTGIKLARQLKAHNGHVKKAVMAVVDANANGGKGTKATPKGRTAGALKAWARKDAKMVPAIIKAAELLGIKNLGIKVSI